MIKELYKKFIEAEKKSDEIDRQWELFPHDRQLEDAWAEAYQAQKDALNALMDEIQKGGIGTFEEREQIRKAIYTRRNELEAIIAGL